MEEIIDDLDDEYDERVDFVEISVNSNSREVKDQIRKYNVKLVPTMIFLNSNGEQIARVEGAVPREQIVYYIEEGLKK